MLTQKGWMSWRVESKVATEAALVALRAIPAPALLTMFWAGLTLLVTMPVVLLTLVKIGILSYAMLSKMRRYMIVINLVLGAVLTTPEVLTQVMRAFPLQVLYEITVWIAWYWERRDRKREEAERRREEEQLKRHHSAPHDA